MSQTRVKVLEASIQFVTQLQKLFALMALSEKKYVDPTEILQSLVDDKGCFFFFTLLSELQKNK